MTAPFTSLVALAALATLTACTTDTHPLPAGDAGVADAGTHSGIAATRLVTSLSATELHALCVYVADVAGGPEVDCDGGLPLGGPTVAECEAMLSTDLPAGCTSTVRVVESCYEAFAADHCGFIANPDPACSCG
jgi:predicted small lipoprotein YifL